MVTNSARLWNKRVHPKTVASCKFSPMVIFKWTTILFICTVILRGELQKALFFMQTLGVFTFVFFYLTSSAGENSAEVTVVVWLYS